MAKGTVEISAGDMDALLPYVTVDRWLRELRPWTKRHCLRNMVRFNRIAGKDPDQILAWAKTQDGLDVQDLIDHAAEGLTPALQVLAKADIRSFLRHNGYNNLPKTRLRYTPKEWHRGYNREEVRKLLSFLDNLHHKLFVLIAIETGLRAQTILDIRYRHIKEDFEAGIIPVAIRLDPEYYNRPKAAGYTFLGPLSVATLKEFLGNKTPKDEDPIVPLKYIGIYDALRRAKEKARLDKTVQISHGLRKYFEHSLDNTGMDPEKKAVIEGHFAGTRSKHYTSRVWDEVRADYRKAIPYIDPWGSDPELSKKLESWEEEKTALQQRIAALEKKLVPVTTTYSIPTEWYKVMEKDAGERGISVKDFIYQDITHPFWEKKENKELWAYLAIHEYWSNRQKHVTKDTKKRKP